MAYNKRTWLGRQGTGLNKFSIGGASPVTIVNQPDSVTQVGDALSAGNLNDLEDRIEDAFDDVDTALDTKADEQDVTNLNNALTAIDHRVSNLEQAHGSYEVKPYKDGSITPSGKGAWSIVEGLRGVSRVKNNALSTIHSFGLYHCSLVSYSEGVLTVTGFSVGSQVYKPSIVVPSDRTVLGGIWVKPSKATYAYVSLGSSTLVNTVQLPANVWTFLCNEKALTSATVEFSLYVNVNNDLGASDTVQVKEAFLTDLTLYFGGTIPSDADTIAKIQQNYPHLLTPSEYGVRIVDSSYSGVRAWARNLVDPSVITPNKYVDDGSGNLMSNSTYVASDYLPVVPNKTYYYKTDESRGRWGAWYDENKVYISGISGSGEKTAPSNAKYARVTGCTDNYLTTLCFSLSDSLDGTFTEYHAPSTLSLTFQGKSAGSVYDSCEPNVEVSGVAKKRTTERIGEQDLSQIAFTYNSSFASWRSNSAFSLAKPPASNDDVANIMLAGFVAIKGNDVASTAVMSIAMNIGGNIWVNNGSSSTPPSGTMRYELATESVTLSDPLIDNTLLTEAGGRMATVQTGTVVDGSFDMGFITL